VSNFLIHHLDDLLKTCSIVPAVNQVELHPLLNQSELIKYCKSKSIQVEAYSSLGSGELIGDTNCKKIADKHKKSTAQVLLRWAIQQEIPILPKSERQSRIKENTEIFDFELDEADMQTLNSMNKNTHYCWNPSAIA